MPVIRIAARRNATQRVCVGGARARPGAPAEATNGHHEPAVAWSFPSSAPSGIALTCVIDQRGRRLATVGMTSKLCGGGGEGMVHSSVAPPHGSLPATLPRVRVRQTLTRKTAIDTPIRNAPTVDTRLSLATPSSGP